MNRGTELTKTLKMKIENYISNGLKFNMILR